jgi:SAM-dependent methyltransferase
MDYLRKTYLIILVVMFCCLTNCRNNSNDSMQPYDGYRLQASKEEMSRMLKDKCIDTIRFEKGETIADVGAGNGSVEAMLSVFHDSITFYIQDIDTVVCNQKAIEKVIADYQGVSNKVFTNRFIAVEGADNETNLPDNTFDKILILWTYQYFKNPQAIMADLKQKLKTNGLLYIANPDVDIESSKSLQSEHGWNASPVEKEISDVIECGFELIKVSRNYEDPENPYIMVFRKNNR